jgi:hypothetical protein
VRKILSAKARLQGEKRSKVGHLASIFNAAGAFLSQKIAACKGRIEGRISRHAIEWNNK